MQTTFEPAYLSLLEKVLLLPITPGTKHNWSKLGRRIHHFKLSWMLCIYQTSELKPLLSIASLAGWDGALKSGAKFTRD